MSIGQTIRIGRSLRWRWFQVLLIAAHLPLLGTYLSGLWQQTHYQFFPFAIGTFVWLFATRRSGEPERWTWLARILIGIDILFLVAGCGLNSPWLVMVGLVLGLTAWCLANRDVGYYRRLTYLALLPLLVVRLPLQYDLEVINGLQRVTTAVASKTLHRLGMLHFCEGNVLQFPGRSFMVAEACSGVQSLFTILFIAALVICLKRRSLIHGAVLLACGVVFAGVMNTMRVVTISIAWDRYATDWSNGLSHDVLGYVCLGVAAIMLMSADAFLGFITDPVPDVAREQGPIVMYWNPLTRFWNQVVSVLPPADSCDPLKPLQTAAGPRSAFSLPSSQRRLFPSGPELLRPSNWYHFFLGWAECWWYSRVYQQLLAGLPFAAMTVSGILLVWWLKEASEEPLLARYENAFNMATQSGDTVRQETYLRALGSLRSSEPQYRFRLAQLMMRQGRREEGLSEILRLTPEAGQGLADARMWLVEQALQPNALQPMSLDQVEKQLTVVLSQVPKHLQAHLLLAGLYLQRSEWKLAEKHLIEAASIQPERNLALAKLMQAIKRSDKEVQAIAQRAVDALTIQLDVDRTTPEIRAALAEALALAGSGTEARDVLVSGLAQQDDGRLRKALTNFDLIQIERRLTDSPLNRDACVPVVIDALQRDPGNPGGMRLLLRMNALGSEFSAESIRSTLDHWQNVVAATPDDFQARVVLSELLFCVGDSTTAAATLRPTIAAHPELRLTFARILLHSGNAHESTAMLETLRSESSDRLAANARDPVAAVQMAGAQLALGHADDARAILATFADDPAKSRIPADAALAALYGQACLASFDTLTGYQSNPRRMTESTFSQSSAGLAPGVLLDLLTDAANCGSSTDQAIDRIARLSLSSHPAASGAEALVRQVRMEGAQGAEILNRLGMHALVMRRFDKAQFYLEQANAQTRGRNPMILNNLSTAIIRGGTGESTGRALQLANQTLVILPDHPDVLSTRGEIYVAMERWTDAIGDLTESLKFRNDSVVVHRLLEQAYAGLPDPQMASMHRQRASQLEAAQVAY